jgi:cobalt-zinc-cadmium efflux system membrane fusion protein
MRIVCVFAAFMFTACTERKPETVEAEAIPKQEAAPTNEVVLDSQAQRDSGIVVTEVGYRSVPQTLEAPGRITLNENRTWRVGAVTEGRVVQIMASPGDPVKEGQVLARVHSHEIHEARATFQKNAGELIRLQALEAHQQRLRDRARRLFELKAGSLEQLERAESELKNAEAAVEAAKVEVERARVHLVDFLGIPAEPTPHDKGDPREGDDDLIPVRAPAAGVIMQRDVTQGTVVEAAKQMFVVADISTLWLLAQVAEEHLAKLRVGMPARIFVQAHPGRAFAGKIMRLGEELDPATRTIQVRIAVPNPGELLKPEMYARVELDLGSSSPALVVPQSATQEVSGHTVIFVRKAADRFEVRPVELGPRINGEVQVVRGLKAGEAVATRGSFILKSQLLKSALTEE